jgi:DNA-binding transcriptional MerR regulator
MRIQKPKRKLVYSLREVCRLTGLSDAVIKRWEVQYPQIKPVRNRASNRSYLEKDLKLIFYIRDLVYVHKLDDQEIHEKLKSYNPIRDTDSPSYLKGVLSEIKLEIEEIRNMLSD